MRSTLCFLIFFFISQQSFGQTNQPRWFLGVVGGYNSNNHSGGFLGPTSHNELLPYTGSQSTSAMFGLASEYWFTHDGTMSLQFKLYYEQKPGNFISNSTFVVF